MVTDRSWRNSILVFGLAAAAVAGCNFKIDKQAVTPSIVGASVEGRVLGYNSLRAKVFEPHCFECHGDSGDVNLETYEAAKSVLSRIENEAVIEKSMPPTGPLAESDQTLIRRWVEAGGPEDDVVIQPGGEPNPQPSAEPSSQPSAAPSPEPSAAPSPEPSAAPSPTPSPQPSAAPSPSPTSSPTPAPVNFATLSAQLFVPQCLKCHDANRPKPKANVTLNTYADVIHVLEKIKKEVLVKNAMPPRSPLSAELKSLLQSWVDRGTPER